MKYFYKKIVNTPLSLILLPCILMLAGSCEEQPTDYRSFLEEKELVYPAAVVRVEPGPGRYRVSLKWKRSPAPSVLNLAYNGLIAGIPAVPTGTRPHSPQYWSTPT